jgi:hypothetical protein
MILPARKPLEPHGQPLRALQISLNSPVVNLEVLPRGPASAAVAVHAQGATLCVRSLRTGQAAFFTTTEDLGDRRVSLEAALSFAESMGFLFEDDVVAARGDAGPEEAARLWRELCGDRLAADEPSDATPDPGEAAPAPPLVDPARVLSKFRFAAEAAP